MVSLLSRNFFAKLDRLENVLQVSFTNQAKKTLIVNILKHHLFRTCLRKSQNFKEWLVQEGHLLGFLPWKIGGECKTQLLELLGPAWKVLLLQKFSYLFHLIYFLCSRTGPSR